MTGRYDESLYGVAVGMSFSVMWLGIMVAAWDLAVDVSSLHLGIVIFLMGIMVLAAGLGGIHITIEQKRWAAELEQPEYRA